LGIKGSLDYKIGRGRCAVESQLPRRRRGQNSVEKGGKSRPRQPAFPSQN